MGLGLRRRRDDILSRLAGVRQRVPAGVALTFDDGPAPATTGPLLDLLARLDVKATFFCVGRNAEQHPALLGRIIAEGHGLGSHSLTHASRGVHSRRALAQDYLAGRWAVEDAAGRPIPLFRPPYGLLTGGTVQLMRSWETWTWTVDPRDWQAEATAASVLAALRDVGDGDVVLLHDWLEPQVPHSDDRTATFSAVEQAVDALRGAGVGFVTLPGSGGTVAQEGVPAVERDSGTDTSSQD